MAQFHLTYFDLAARAEFVRLLFAYGGIPLTQTRLSFEEYAAKKPTLDLPFNQVPTLQVDGKAYAQSIAIARYAAKLTGLYPNDPLQALQADSIVDAILDLINAAFPVVFGKHDPATRADKLENLNTKVFPARLSALEKQVQGPYFGGDSVSFADIFLLDLFDNTLHGFPGKIEVSTSDYPKLEAIITSLRASENLKEYYAAKA